MPGIPLTDAGERIDRLRRKPWNEHGFMSSVPPALFEVTSMLWTEEKRMLYYLAQAEYVGEGAIIDMGVFLGGSTVCLGEGLRERGFADKHIHAYDLFRLGDWERQTYFSENAPESTRALFDQNISNIAHLVDVHEGDVLQFHWTAGPIEILFVDIAKSYKVFDHLVLNFFPHLLPRRSLVILQDYLSPNTGPWHHVVMEKLKSYFTYVTDCTAASALFLLERAPPVEAFRAATWLAMDIEEKLFLMDAAIARLDTEEKRQFLRSNREMLLSGQDLTWGHHYHLLSED